MRAATRALGLLAIAQLAACQAGLAQRATPNRPANAPSPPSSASPQAPRPSEAGPSGPPPASQAPRPEASASAQAAPLPSLPLRLSLALPSSLVGSAGRKRLSGEDGRLAPEGTRLSLGPGGLLVSNNGGSLWQKGGGIISNHSGGLISDQGGSLVGQPGGSALGPQARRLAQVDLAAEGRALQEDRRLTLWFELLFVELFDQMLQAYAQAGPRLGEWVPFRIQPQLLPPPNGSVLLQGILQQVGASATEVHLAGLVRQEGEGLALWLVRLPQAGARPAEGELCLDLRAPAQGPLKARFLAPPELKQTLGLRSGAMGLEALPEGGVALTTGHRFLPWEEMPPTSRFLQSERQPLASLRRSRFSLRPSGQAELRLAESQRLARNARQEADDWASHFLVAMGFAGPGQADEGLAYWERYGEGPAQGGFPIHWFLAGKRGDTGGPPLAGHLNAQGEAVATPSEALRGLLPSWQPRDEGALPTPPPPDYQPERDPLLAPQAPPP